MRCFFVTAFLAISVVLFTSACTAIDRGVSIVPKAAPVTDMGLGSYHAVLIGINNYKALPKLKTPINDVEALAKLLKKEYGFEDVTQITDKTKTKPTASEIVKALRTISQKLSGKDNLLIYYAGHGNLDDLTKEGYWIPIDGKPDDPTSWVPHSLIRNLLESEKVKVKNFLLVADSCYSGAMMRRNLDNDNIVEDDENVLNEKLKERASRKSREVITSGGNEPVADGTIGSDHSLFAYYFLKALENNRKRYADIATLFSLKVQPMVDQRGKQRPDRSRVQGVSDEDGLFVLARQSVTQAPKQPKVEEELARVSKENKEMRRQLEQERSVAAQRSASLQKLAEEKRIKEQETERVKKALEQEKKKADTERKKPIAEQKKVAEAQRIKAERERYAKMMEAEQTRINLKRTREIESPAKSRVVPSNGNGRFLIVGKVIIDKKSRLMWLKNANEPARGMDMKDAMQYVDNLKCEGYSDWRIPSNQDWRGLMDKPGGLDGSLPEGHPFSNIVTRGSYWTSSANPLGVNHGFVINVVKGSVEQCKKTDVGFIWPVRNASKAEMRKALTEAGAAGTKRHP